MENNVHRDKHRNVLAFVLIGIGMLWILRHLGVYFNFHVFWDNLFYPFRTVFHNLAGFIFSWQIILIIIGLVLMAGRRSIGIVLVVIGGVFLLPKLFFFPHFSLSFLFPVLLIGIGIAMVARVL